MILDYNAQRQFQNQLQIDDIGNIGLICSTEDGVEYYLALKTIMGKVMEVKFGPLIPDAPLIPDFFSLFYRTLQYKEPVIIKEINSFINDPKKKIIDIKVVSPEELIDLIPDKNLYLEDNE